PQSQKTTRTSRQTSCSGVVRELALVERLFPKGYPSNAHIVRRAHAALASPTRFTIHIPVRGDRQVRASNRPTALRQCAKPQIFSVHLPDERRLREPHAVQSVGIWIVCRKEHGSNGRGSPP